VLVHDPDAEAKFVEDGFGVNRKLLMENDFVIIGPEKDPAGIKGTKDAAAALSKIAKAQITFVSRGDESGTNKKELALWKKAGIKPQGEWYLSAGQGMGAVITMADNKQGYTLSDRSTYLSRIKNVQLQILVEGDPELINKYSAIAVNPNRFPHVKYQLAMKLIDWLCSPEGQKLIGDFTVNGNKLFRPMAGQDK